MGIASAGVTSKPPRDPGSGSPGPGPGPPASRAEPVSDAPLADDGRDVTPGAMP
jgi:hypothetical protein